MVNMSMAMRFHEGMTVHQREMTGNPQYILNIIEYIYICIYIMYIPLHAPIMSKGKCGYPWESTQAVVPKILPHIALNNHYNPLYKPYMGGICWYISRVLSQGYPTFLFDNDPVHLASVRFCIFWIS